MQGKLGSNIVETQLTAAGRSEKLVKATRILDEEQGQARDFYLEKKRGINS